MNVGGSFTQKFEAPAQKADPPDPIKVQSNFFRRNRYMGVRQYQKFENP